jgi:peroxiredoxin
MPARWFAGIVIAFALVLGYFSIHGSSIFASTPDVTAANSRQAAPEFSKPDAKGASVRLSDFKGKVVLLNFWATWCHGCQTEIPWFIDFQNQFKHSGLAVLGVSMDDDGWKSVTPFVAAKKVNYPVIIGDEPLGKLYNLGNMPRTVLIDREGRIAASYDGVVDRAKCEADIRALLGEKP